MQNKNLAAQVSEADFHSAAALIKWLAFAVALMAVVISKYAFIFFAAGMLPTLIAIFLDRGTHKCASATICTFNLIGILPYLIRLWSSRSVHLVAKLIIADINTWMIIYGSAFIGQILYILLPLLIVKLYEAQGQIKVATSVKQAKLLSEEWGINQDDQ